MRELAFQSEIVADVRAAGGYAKKLSHRMLAGVPDILVKLPNYPAALIECKAVPWPKMEKTPLNIETTALQKRELQLFRDAMGLSGVFLFSQIGRMKLCLVITGLEADFALQKWVKQHGFAKNPGLRWPVEAMVGRLSAQFP